MSVDHTIQDNDVSSNSRQHLPIHLSAIPFCPGTLPLVRIGFIPRSSEVDPGGIELGVAIER
jgi:hypothetical protein